ARADIALYVGGMGPRGANFYTEVVSRLGWAGAAARIQDLFLDGHRHAAAAAVPDDLLEALTLIGAPAAVAARLRALREAGVDTLVVRGLGDRPAEQLAVLRALMDAA
ncbi:MAG: LLM class flavin-dependent oxidoreductase, partial [Thermoleophilia bacterium]